MTCRAPRRPTRRDKHEVGYNSVKGVLVEKFKEDCQKVCIIKWLIFHGYIKILSLDETTSWWVLFKN